MSDRKWKRTQRQKRAIEVAMQQRYAEIEVPIVQKRPQPGYRKVVVCVPGQSPAVVEEREEPLEP